MPPKRKSADDLPEDRVYKRQSPKRRVVQTRFAPPKQTYSRKKTTKIPLKGLTREELNRQNQASITQVWAGELALPDEDQLEGAFLQDEDVEGSNGMIATSTLPDIEPHCRKQDTQIWNSALSEDADDNFEEYGKKVKANRAKRKPAAMVKAPTQKRITRRSTGSINALEKKQQKTRRKTEGDTPSGTAELHTQTLTQWERSFTSAADLDEVQDNLNDKVFKAGAEEQPAIKKSIYDIPSSSQSLGLPRRVTRLSMSSISPTKTSPRRNAGPSSDMGPPQTPRRAANREIPSSQSPATPLSLSSGGSVRRQPLEEKCTNIAIPFKTHHKPHCSPDKVPKLLSIADTFDSEMSISDLTRISTTPSKKSSPVKSVRFALEEDGAEDGATDTPEETPSKRTRLPETATPGPDNEILDSDVESDAEENHVQESQNDMGDRSSPDITAVETIHDLTERDDRSTGEDDRSQRDYLARDHEDPDTYYAGASGQTQLEANLCSQLSQDESVPLDDDREDHSQEYDKERTQLLESQRLPHHIRQAMAPITAESDVFISLHPSKVSEILGRTRDHEIRNWHLPPPVRRLWIYETAPIKAVKYMAEIGPSKRPGEISDGGSAEKVAFNTRSSSSAWTAYEILQLYELSDTQPWDQMKAKGWLSQPPTKFTKIAPAVVGELVHNLRPPLFESEQQETISSSLTDTQEAEAQLLNTMKQFTQIASQEQPAIHIKREEEDTAEEPPPSANISSPIIGAGQITFTSAPESVSNPSQATTVDLTQTQVITTPRRQRSGASPSEIIWESPSRPIPPSSSSLHLPTPKLDSSQVTAPETMIHPFSLASSQLMSKSQMLPESLLEGSLEGPSSLEIVRDSDDEDGIEDY